MDTVIISKYLITCYAVVVLSSLCHGPEPMVLTALQIWNKVDISVQNKVDLFAQKIFVVKKLCFVVSSSFKFKVFVLCVLVAVQLQQ